MPYVSVNRTFSISNGLTSIEVADADLPNLVLDLAASFNSDQRPNDAQTLAKRRITICLALGLKLKAIGIYREHFNTGLAEAKAAVEGIALGMPF